MNIKSNYLNRTINNIILKKKKKTVNEKKEN